MTDKWQALIELYRADLRKMAAKTYTAPLPHPSRIVDGQHG